MKRHEEQQQNVLSSRLQFSMRVWDCFFMPGSLLLSRASGAREGSQTCNVWNSSASGGGALQKRQSNALVASDCTA